MSRWRVVLVLVAASLLAMPISAGAHDVDEELLIGAFNGQRFDEDLEHHRLKPFRTFTRFLACEGDLIGSWAYIESSFGRDGDFDSRKEMRAFFNRIEHTYELDVNGDGDPVPLVVEQTPLSGPPHQIRTSAGVPVIDNALLPLGFHRLYWDILLDGELLQANATRFGIVDCDRETHLVADANDVGVTVWPSQPSEYFSLIFLDQPYDQFIGVDTSNADVTLADVGVGTDLVFRIEVWECADGTDWGDPSCADTGRVFYSGPAAGNTDGQNHALHVQDDSTTFVHFNESELEPGYEPIGTDYTGAVFQVHNASP